MATYGFVKLHRKLIEWGWYSDCVVKDVFLHILMTANYREGQYMGHDIKPGQAVIGRKMMSKELGFSEQQIRTALKKLESTGEITLFPTNRFTIATVENWAIYQGDDCESNQQITNNHPTDNQQITNNQPHHKKDKNNKKDKNDKNNIYAQVPQELVQTLKDFEEHRKKLKAPLTDHSLGLLVKKANKLAGGDTQMMIDIFNQSMERGWKGVFAIDEDKAEQKGRNDWLDEL